MFGADEAHGPASKDAVRKCLAEGRVVACEAVWAEIAGLFPTTGAAETAMNALGVGFDQLDRSSALAAGKAWKAYRDRGGGRTRVVADFLIGAHALLQAERLLTRDRGFYRAYFGRLRVLDPSA